MHQKSIEAAFQFEKLVFEVLRKHYRIERSGGQSLNDRDLASLFQARPDFVITAPLVPVEVKFTSSSRASTGLLNQAVEQLKSHMLELDADGGLLLVSSMVDLGDVLTSRDQSIRIWGLGEIISLCGDDTELRSRLLRFVQEELPFFRLSEISFRSPTLNFSEKRSARVGRPTQGFKRRIPRNFCVELRALKTTKKDSRTFERIATEALKYCFENHLIKWMEQARTDSGRSFYDLVASVASEHDFWNMIRRDFKTAYVVFEFKNYSEKISQTQIYTTEKYLYEKALRSVAFMLCRNGANTHALAAAKGALREHGKLIVCFTLDDLCEMVALRDRGDDPTAVLANLVDEILLRIER